MATTTKSKAKTKTRKPAAAKRTAAAKTSKKSVSAKAARSTTPKVQPRNGVLSQLRTLHLLSVLSGIVLAAATLIFASAHVVPVTISYTTQNSLLSNEQAVFVPAERVWYEIDVRWLLVALLAVFAVYSLLLLTRWRASYEKAIAGRIVFWRWVELAIVGSLMVKIAAMLSGVQNEMTLKLMVGSIIAGAGFAWLSERQNERLQGVRSAHALSALGFLLPWLIIAGSLLATTVYGGIRLPWYAYALTVVGGLSFTGLHINQWLQHRRIGRWAGYASAERNHVLGSLLVKIVFAVVLVAGLYN